MGFETVAGTTRFHIDFRGAHSIASICASLRCFLRPFRAFSLVLPNPPLAPWAACLPRCAAQLGASIAQYLACSCCQPFWSCVAPCGLDGFGGDVFVGSLQTDAGCTTASPGAFHRDKCGWVVFGEIVLVFG